MSRRQAVIAVLVVGALFGPTLYWAFTYSGLYRVFAEVQQDWFGGYRPVLTGIVTLLAVGVPLIVVVGSVRWAVTGKIAPQKQDDGADLSGEEFLERHKNAIIGLFVGVGVLGFGLWLWVPALLSSGEATLTVRDLSERSSAPSFVVLTELGDIRGSVEIKEGAYSTYYHAIGRPSATAFASAPVVVEVLERQASSFDAAFTSGQLRGKLSQRVPGDVSFKFGSAITSGAWLLEYDRTAAEASGEGLVISLLGAGIAIFSGLMIARRRRA